MTSFFIGNVWQCMTWEPVKEMVSCYIPWSATNTGFCYLTFLHTHCSTVKLLYVEVEAKTGNVVQTSSTWWRYTENGSNDITPKPFCFHKPSSETSSLSRMRHHIKESEESICQSTWNRLHLTATWQISLLMTPTFPRHRFLFSVAKRHEQRASSTSKPLPSPHSGKLLVSGYKWARYLVIWISSGYNLKILKKWWTK